MTTDDKQTHDPDPALLSAAWEAAHPYVETAEDSAAHGAGESEEQ